MAFYFDFFSSSVVITNILENIESKFNTQLHFRLNISLLQWQRRNSIIMKPKQKIFQYFSTSPYSLVYSKIEESFTRGIFQSSLVQIESQITRKTKFIDFLWWPFSIIYDVISNNIWQLSEKVLEKHTFFESIITEVKWRWHELRIN